MLTFRRNAGQRPLDAHYCLAPRDASPYNPRMSDDFYDRIATYYDLEFHDFDTDAQLYLGYAGLVGSPILELGCGTGRLLLALAQAGYQVTGIDRSPAMLAIARQRVHQAHLDTVVAIEEDDMRDLGRFPDQYFRLVFAAINGFLHLPDRTQQLQALAAVRRVLHPDGLLILDIFHPTPAILGTMDDRLTRDGSWQLPGDERLDRFTHRHIFPAEQRVRTTHYYDHVGPAGAVHRTIADYDLRYVHRFELETLLDLAGFAIEGIYGSYALDLLEDDSATMIFVAHRRMP